MSLIGFGLHGNLGAGGLRRGEGRRPRPADQWEPPSSAAAKPEWQPWRLTIVPPSVAAPRFRRGGVAPQPRGPWHSRLSPSLPGSLFSSSPWPPRAGFTCQRRFRPEQKTRPLTASPGARLPWQRRPRGQAASNHSCWIRLVRALMLGAQTQRHPAGVEPGLQLPRSALPSGAQALPALHLGPRSLRRRLSQGLWPQHISILWPADPPPSHSSLSVSQAWFSLACWGINSRAMMRARDPTLVLSPLKHSSRRPSFTPVLQTDHSDISPWNLEVSRDIPLLS